MASKSEVNHYQVKVIWLRLLPYLFPELEEMNDCLNTLSVECRPCIINIIVYTQTHTHIYKHTHAHTLTNIHTHTNFSLRPMCSKPKFSIAIERRVTIFEDKRQTDT